MYLRVYNLYLTIAVLTPIAAYIIYWNLQQRAKRSQVMNDYTSRVRDMADNELKFEVQSLTERSKKPQVVIDDDILERNVTPTTPQMLKVVTAELNKRGITG